MPKTAGESALEQVTTPEYTEQEKAYEEKQRMDWKIRAGVDLTLPRSFRIDRAVKHYFVIIHSPEQSCGIIFSVAVRMTPY